MTLHLSTEDARLLRRILLDFAETIEDMDEEADRAAVATRVAEAIGGALRSGSPSKTRRCTADPST